MEPEQQNPKRRKRTRRGRGRLSSIEMLPPEADDAVVWANLQLQDRTIPQNVILPEFNEKLALVGLGPISNSAFNRHSIKKAAWFNRMARTTEITNALADSRSPKDVDDLTIMAGEMIKTLVVEIIAGGDEGGFSPKETMEMARAVQAIAQAQSTSSKRRASFKVELDEKVTEAVEKAGGEIGLSAERIAQIRREVLGIPEPANDEAPTETDPDGAA